MTRLSQLIERNRQHLHAGRGKSMTYGKRTLIAVDQLLNTLLGGWPDETLSSRCYRWARDGVRTWPCKFVDGLFFWQKEHCKSSYESEKEGRQSPPELRPLSAEPAGQ